MFQFTTTTIINKNEDHSTKNPLIVTHDLDTKLGENEVQIKRVANFDKAFVTSITKAPFEEASLSTVKLRMVAPEAKNVYRIALYIKLQDSQNSYYANNFVYKGKPLYIEAVAPDTNPAHLLNEFIKNAKKYITMVYEKELVTMDNGKGANSILDITGTDAHQVFTQAEIQHWIEPNMEKGENVGHWDTIVVPKEGENVVGNPGFGTYEHLLHNYVLPTGANLRYGHILENEVPMVNGKYTQYIITMKKPRGIMGGDAVGQPAESITTHVFWVESGVTSIFDDAMVKLGSASEINKVKAAAASEVKETKTEKSNI